MRSFKLVAISSKRGFTLVELLVSVGILLIITGSVVSDIQRTRQQEELASSVRLVQGALRDAQADALAAIAVSTCVPDSQNILCENGDVSNCASASCDTSVSPSAYGLTFTNDSSVFTFFADVYTNDLKEDATGYETLDTFTMARVSNGIDTVSVSALEADSVEVDEAIVTFDRQSGNMRINACLSGTCIPAEANVLEITLFHSLTEVSKKLYLNAITGRISIQ